MVWHTVRVLGRGRGWLGSNDQLTLGEAEFDTPCCSLHSFHVWLKLKGSAKHESSVGTWQTKQRLALTTYLYFTFLSHL
jgi:hypothetical protein